MNFMTADQAKILSNVANLNIEMYKPRLAQQRWSHLFEQLKAYL
ncbi:hypothetical protein [Acinetobacter lwoffii]|nr:hypothetical protein [Acinetobacter lwoffii]